MAKATKHISRARKIRPRYAALRTVMAFDLGKDWCMVIVFYTEEFHYAGMASFNRMLSNVDFFRPS
jgi:hypothetical protein